MDEQLIAGMAQCATERAVAVPTDADLEPIARVCQEANRAYCMALGDFSQLPWDEAPEWQRKSSIAGVRAQFEIGRYGSITPEQMHDKWLEYKLRDGWRYGEKKDAEAKTHPCLLPFNALPEEEQVKDSLFIALVSVFKQRWYRMADENFKKQLLYGKPLA